jgi:hypothetical protein
MRFGNHQPALQIVEPSWGAPDEILVPTMAVLVFVILVTAFFAGFACIRPRPEDADADRELEMPSRECPH